MNILQCNSTTWSARHLFLTSVFDAALISETHLEEAKLVAAVKEARKSAWAGTGSAAICTANKVQMRECSRWYAHVDFPSPCLFFFCTDKAGVLCLNPRLAERVIRFMGREILLLTAYYLEKKHSVGFRSDMNANLIHDVCFLTRDGRLPFIL